MRDRLLVLIVAASCATAFQASFAQANAHADVLHRTSTPPHDSVDVTVALVSSLPRRGAHAVVMRHRGRASKGVILLTPRADATDLYSAANSFTSVRHQYGDSLSVDMRKYVMHDRHPSRFNALELVRAQKILDEVRASAPSNVPGVGLVKATKWRLPPRSN